MCLSIPYKITKINGQRVEALSPDKKKVKFLNLLEKLRIGGYVITQNGLVVKKIKYKKYVSTTKNAKSTGRRSK